MNKISILKKQFKKNNTDYYNSVLSSLIKKSSFIENIIIDLNKLPDDEQRSNYLNRFKRNMFMIEEYWYRDLSESDKIQLQNVINRY